MELIRKKDEIKYKGDRSGEGVGDNIEGGRGGGGGRGAGEGVGVGRTRVWVDGRVTGVYDRVRERVGARGWDGMGRG